MKICQTLWTNHKDLLEDSFGWLSPQHHLMAWAFSCLKLREFYPNVQLYTDSYGAEILVDALNLPYTTCHVEYDNLKYYPSLWAFPKILTYKKQVEPFIHVDGDVFLFDKFNDTLEKSALIAQNLEVSTGYYNTLFSPIMKRIQFIPDFFRKNLNAKYPKSYNAGILGGNNLELIQRYTSEAISFVDQNHTCQSNGNLNMIFEQLMFFSIAKTNNTEVKCYFDKIYNDNGYILNEFGDFLSVPKMKYLHLIGPLKRNEFVCKQLTRKFFDEYPGHFERVISLFSQESHFYFPLHKCSGKQNNTNPGYKRKYKFHITKSLIDNLYPENSIQSNKKTALYVKEKNNQILNEVYAYEKKLHRLLTNKFSRIDRVDILNIEKKVIQSNPFLIDIQDGNFSCVLTLNPYIEIIETPFDVIDFNPYEVLRGENNQKTIACIPQLFFDGYRTVNLDPVAINIISILYDESKPVTYSVLESEMFKLFDRVDNDECSIRSLMILKIKFLIGNNLIYIDAI